MRPLSEDADNEFCEDTGGSEIRDAMRATSAFRLLVVIDGAAVTHDLPAHGRVTLGRARGSHVPIAHVSVSRDHAFLDLAPLAIVDRNSRNGTYVRGAAIDAGVPVMIAVDEPFRIGDVMVMVQSRIALGSVSGISDGAPSPVNLVAECARSVRTGAAFAFARILVDPAVTERACEALMGTVRVSDQLSQAPGELRVLFTDTPATSLGTVVDRLLSALDRAGISARVGAAGFPIDGTTPIQLAARTWQQLLRGQGAPDPIAPVRDTLARLAVGDLSLLLCGETGVGKEVYAEIIHRASLRSRGPLIKVNCAALTETLLESELFGHERGAFTGAASAHAGLIEAADGGTLFLDEIGELPLMLQAKLLRVLEDREVRRVGGTSGRQIDVRFVAATNRSLEAEVAAGRFRRDLLFRIAGATITIPPLRQRRDDIEAIARAVIEQARTGGGAVLSYDAIVALRNWHWPGNVRELRNTIERALLVARNGTIVAHDLGLETEIEVTGVDLLRRREGQAPLGASVEAHEREQILAALEHCGGNKTQAARMLGIARNTLLARLDAWGLRDGKK
ncbi:MAG TPA: sigma 54-interacting transcriptional regulator [Kofleriaceae bacterium]|nr:sigma 54-interacting transcriptional regulator [Kofleriaceae bacterium]